MVYIFIYPNIKLDWIVLDILDSINVYEKAGRSCVNGIPTHNKN